MKFTSRLLFIPIELEESGGRAWINLANLAYYTDSEKGVRIVLVGGVELLAKGSVEELTKVLRGGVS